MTDRELDPQLIEDIAEMLAQGHKIEAIKAYRKATGLGLKESKEFIDQLIPQLLEQDPERFAALSRGGSGCGAAVLVLAACAMTVVAVVCFR